MTDRELLELAAKAANQELKYDTFGGGDNPEREYNYWNPLMDDGDAFCLAVKLHLKIDVLPWGTIAAKWNESMYDEEAVRHNNDPYAATRRAIVRAAAEIGRSLT